jgi:hypothetical protein
VGCKGSGVLSGLQTGNLDGVSATSDARRRYRLPLAGAGLPSVMR